VKVLVTRTDKLGDLVLALPALAYLKQRRPDWQVHGMVSPYTLPLVENDPHLDAVWTYGEDKLPELMPQLATEKFTAAVMLHYERPLAAALYKLKVPRRVGAWSKWSSWFLLNRGVWLRKSRGKHHERDQNVKLVQKLVGKGGQVGEPCIHLTSGQREWGHQFLQEQGVAAEQVVYVHPGSGGSALNWAPACYAAVANELATDGNRRVFVTGGSQDEQTVAAVTPLLAPQVQVIAGCCGLREFLGLLAAGDLLVGPSTGPLHIAGALGLAVVGLYPPISSQSIVRWGPLGPWQRALAPDLRCPGRMLCFEERCRHWNCMSGISEQAVVAAARAVLAERGNELADGDAQDACGTAPASSDG
jgi:ADP-heptose:LPS heptosyltransferase